MNSSCSVLPESIKPPSSADEKPIVDIDDERKDRIYRLPCVHFTVAVLIMIILTGLFTDQSTITVNVNEDKIATDYGKSIILTCDLSVICTCFVKSIKWYKDKKKIECCPSNTTKYESVRRRPMLTIKDVGINDLGDYTCVLETMFSTYKSENIQVVYALPVITVKEKTIEILENRKSINISCEVCSESELITIKWFKGSDEICGNNQKFELKGTLPKELAIHDVCLSDCGTYKCRVENKNGYTESEEITVVPQMPTEIQRMNSKDRDIYMAALKSGKEVRRYIRIQVIGKNGVGKSCLVRRLLGKEIQDVVSTDGIEIFKTCQIDTRDGKWLVDKFEGERKERIKKRILQIVGMNRKQTERPVVQKGNVGETKSAKQETLSSTEQKIITKPQAVGEKPKIENNIADNISATSNSSEHKLNIVDTSTVDTSLLTDTKLDNINSGQMLDSDIRSHEHEKPEFHKITDEMTKNIFGQMDSIIHEVNKEKDDLKSEDVVECGIWDFAGQKEYYVTHKTFLTSNAIYLLVTNLEEDIEPIGDNQNFDSIGEYIDFWFDSIHSLCGDPSASTLNPAVIMVCTHADMFKDLQKRKSEYSQQFLNICGHDKKFNHKRSMQFISNTVGTGDMDELKREINKIAEEMGYFRVELPTHWIQLENALDFLTRNLKTHIISWTTIVELAYETGIEDEEQLITFLNYQHTIGNIIFFENMRDFIILNPIWLIKCFRCLVFDDIHEKRSSKISTTEWMKLTETGELSKTVIDCLFEKEDDLESEHKQYLLGVMENFDIIVKPQCADTRRDTSSNSYFIPCMIRKQPTSLVDIKKSFGADKNKLTTSPWLILEFTFLPFAYFNHILVSYIREYTVCGKENEQKALYGGKAVFFLEETKSRKFIMCFSKNAIALQIWDWDQRSDDPYKKVLETIRRKIKELETKIRHITTYSITAKCSDGKYYKKDGRICYEEREKVFLSNGNYFCSEHNAMHSTDEIVDTWFKHVDEHDKQITSMENSNNMIVAALDIGITYSGYAFSFRNDFETDPFRIQENPIWMSGSGQFKSIKTPTCLLLDKDQKFIAFGFQAENLYAECVFDEQQDDHYYFHRFQMFLHNNDKNKASSMVIEDIAGKTMSAFDVFKIYIQAFVNHLLETLVKQEISVKHDDVQWVITVPAIWTDIDIQFMRSCAVEAGIHTDKLSLVLEPEAVSLLCHYQTANKELSAQMGLEMFKIGTKYMVIDLGGNTANITVYEKVGNDQCKKKHRATRRNCGGTSVESRFFIFLENIFGEQLMESLKKEYPLDYLDLERSIEYVKRYIDPNNKVKVTMNIPVATLDRLCQKINKTDFITLVEASDYANEIKVHSNKIRFNIDLIVNVFKPSIDSVISFIREVLSCKSTKGVTHFLLVGGFSECDLLQNEIRKSFPEKRIIKPIHAQMSVLVGAVLFGHSPDYINYE